MRGTHKNLCLDIFTENFASMQQYREKQGFLRHECPEHQRMLAVLRRAMEQEVLLFSKMHYGRYCRPVGDCGLVRVAPFEAGEIPPGACDGLRL